MQTVNTESWEVSSTKAEECFQSAQKLHRYLTANHWTERGLVGPDCGIRLNSRIGRFIKNYLSTLRWHDDLYYLQAQGYWVLANWQLFDQTCGEQYHEIALRCSEQMLNTQRKDGAWDYPNPEWKGRVATAECTWASLGLLETYRHTGEERFLTSVLRWHEFMLDSVGFEKSGDQVSVNYFAKRGAESTPWTGEMVPNNSAFVLRFLSELACVTGDKSYIQHCTGLVAFMRHSQKPNGEFPYTVKVIADAKGKSWEHFQCYQYNAFQCLDLMRYYEISGDAVVPPILESSLRYLRTGLAEDGHVYYDCANRHRTFTYHAGVVGAAFAMAGRLGLRGYEEARDRAFSWLVRNQQPNGSYGYSRGDYFILQDQRPYPRNLAMILFHFLINTAYLRQPGSKA